MFVCRFWHTSCVFLLLWHGSQELRLKFCRPKEGDDCLMRDVFQMQKTKRLCRKMSSVVLVLLFGDEWLDAIEMSVRSKCQIMPDTCERCQRRVEADGRHHRARVIKRTKFWRTKPNGQRKPSCATRPTNCWSVKKRKKPFVQFEERREEAD